MVAQATQRSEYRAGLRQECYRACRDMVSALGMDWVCFDQSHNRIPDHGKCRYSYQIDLEQYEELYVWD